MVATGVKAPNTPSGTASGTPSGAPPRRGGRRVSGRALIAGAPFAYVVLFFVVPVVVVLVKSLGWPGFTLEEYADFASGPTVRQALLNSVWLATQSSLAAAVLGSLLLVALLSWGPRWRRIITMMLLLPFVANELVRIVSWLLLLGPDGPAAGLVEFLGADSAPAMVANRIGVLVGLVHVELPFFTMAALPTLLAIDKALGRASTSLGANPLQRILTVFLPLALPGLIAAWALAFILGLAYYATPTLLGGPGEQVLLPSLIMAGLNTTGDWNQAAALGILLLIVAVIGFALLAATGGLRVIYGGPANTKSRRRAGGGGRWQRFACSPAVRRTGDALNHTVVRRVLKVCHAVIVVATLLYLAAPALSSVPASFTSGSMLELAPDSFSLRWYRALFEDPAWSSALRTSVTVALAAGAAATTLALCAAIALVRRFLKVGSGYFTFLLMPMVMPLPVIALGLYFAMVATGTAFTWQALFLGYTLFALPYATIVLTSALQGFDWELDRAGQSLGAGWMRRLRTIIFPIMRPALGVAFAFSFIIAFTEIIFALFMNTQKMSTLPVQMWMGLRFNLDPKSAAVATLTFGVTILVLVASRAAAWLKRRSRAR